MGKYGTAAIRALEHYGQGIQSADGAWTASAQETFPDALESRRKSCPKWAFLGLCAAGMVRGVERTSAKVDDENVNAAYAVTAARLLAREPELAAAGPGRLWRRVMQEHGLDAGKRPNGQMDVVLSLWNAGHLNVSNPG